MFSAPITCTACGRRVAVHWIYNAAVGYREIYCRRCSRTVDQSSTGPLPDREPARCQVCRRCVPLISTVWGTFCRRCWAIKIKTTGGPT